MKTRFELDYGAATQASQPRVAAEGPESLALHSYDASEGRFAVSLNEPVTSSSRFVVEEHPDGNNVTDTTATECEGMAFVTREVEGTCDEGNATPNQPESLKFFGHELNQGELDSGVPWRQEVSARLTKYHARRRVREPRYPSLQLKFETQETWHDSSPKELRSGPVLNTPALAKSASVINTAPLANPPFPSPVESSSRVIEFPRSSTVAPNHSEELAEPVFVRPRIMEAPELVPGAPALGGILLEPMDVPAYEKRPGFEMPLQSARLARRLAATFIDAIIVFAGLALFVCIFWRATAVIPSIWAAAPTLVVIASILWASYQYLAIVHCGTTLGLKLARLKLSDFDGTAVQKKRRRWRVLASTLSGLSLGLGYAWCFLDEDQLCWHDRITRTYVAPKV